MQTPTVHLNGSPRDVLLEQATTATNALRAALVALDEAAPHPRDYYVRRGAYEAARMEYMDRREKLVSMLLDFEAMSEYLALDPAKAYTFCSEPNCKTCVRLVAVHEVSAE